MVESVGHFAVDKKAYVLADLVLLVDDAVTHAGETRVQHVQHPGQRFAFGFDLALTTGVGKKRAWNQDADQATATE